MCVSTNITKYDEIGQMDLQIGQVDG